MSQAGFAYSDRAVDRATLQQERAEVLASVLEARLAAGDNPERAAAGRLLMRHLLLTAKHC